MISVVGGSGFIGSRLLTILKAKVAFNFDINPPLNDNAPYFKGDVRDLISVDDDFKQVDQLINLAAEHQDNVSPIDLYYSVNVEGAKQVTTLAESVGINKIIFTSSAAVYGLHEELVTEETTFQPFNHYGKSKLQAEKIYIDWQKRTGGCLIILRPTVVFGEGNRGNVYNLLRLLNEGSFKMVGNGSNKKSMAYVGNIAAFIKYCSEEIHEGLHIYNYSDGPDLSMNQLVSIVSDEIGKDASGIRIPYIAGLLAGYGMDLVSKISGRTFPISAVRIKKFCANTQFSSEKIDKETDFKRDFTLIEGLERTIEYEFKQLSIAG